MLLLVVFSGGCFRELFHTQASLRSDDRGGAAASLAGAEVSPPLAGGDCCERRSADISSSSWLLLGLLLVLLILLWALLLLLDGEGMRAEKRRLIRSYMLVHHDACDSKIKKLGGDRLSRCEELGLAMISTTEFGIHCWR